MKAVLSLFAIALFLLLTALDARAADRPDILEIVSLNGIVDERMAEQVTKQVEEINDNPRAKAVLLIVDTPGGGVLASAAIYEELSKLKVPVIGWCNNICASGGMYLLMAPSVKYIGVRSTTISGSIGVVMSVTKFNRLLDWAKVDSTTFKSGKFKDSGNPTTGMQEEERAHLQETIDVLATRFYALVSKARPGIGESQWSDIKTAKIYFGADGVKAGLVDQVMTMEEASKKAKELSGSKLIYTRDEVKKMAKMGERDSFSYEAPRHDRLEELMAQASWLVEVAKEVRAGETIRVEYRMPVKF
jgi:protease IV